MQESRSNLFTSDDTLFGVCEALGQDFGFNPIYLRVTLAVSSAVESDCRGRYVSGRRRRGCRDTVPVPQPACRPVGYTPSERVQAAVVADRAALRGPRDRGGGARPSLPRLRSLRHRACHHGHRYRSVERGLSAAAPSTLIDTA